MTASVLVPGKGRETWGVMALKGGRWEILWNAQAGGMRRMNGTFRLATSKDEARDLLVAKIETDPAFAAEYEGWTFFFVLLDDCVECRRAA